MFGKIKLPPELTTIVSPLRKKIERSSSIIDIIRVKIFEWWLLAIFSLDGREEEKQIKIWKYKLLFRPDGMNKQNSCM